MLSVRRATPSYSARLAIIDISIHALREEGDALQTISASRPTNFYPRPPRGGRLGIGTRIVEVQVVSIHALREEGDIFQR